jgi:hypothetical protein
MSGQTNWEPPAVISRHASYATRLWGQVLQSHIYLRAERTFISTVTASLASGASVVCLLSVC